SAVTNSVLKNSASLQQKLGADGREVRAYTVTLFYVQLLEKSGLDQLPAASLQELLRRTDSLRKGAEELNDRVKELWLASERETQDDRRRRVLEDARDKITDLESAQAQFRDVHTARIRNRRRFPDPRSPAALGDRPSGAGSARLRAT